MRPADPNIKEIVSPWERPVDLHGRLTDEPEPIAWYVSSRMQLGRGHVLSALGGSSKTRLLYHLAIGAVTRRLPWDWTIETAGRAVLVLTEDTEEDVYRTLYHMARGLGLSEHEVRRVESGIITYALAGTDMKLLAKGELGALTKTPHFYELEATIKAAGNVVFIGLDPALALTTGDEMDQNDQRELGKMADDLAVRTGAATCLSAHSTKATLRADELTSHNSRGAGAITDAVRGEYAMRNMTADEAAKAGITDLEERKRHVQLVATKGNHLPPAAYVPVWLRRGEHGTLSEAEVSFEQTDELASRDNKALEVLREMAAAHVPTLDDWRTECVSRGIVSGKNDEAVRKAMQRIVTRLRNARRVEPGIGRGRWVPVLD